MPELLQPSPAEVLGLSRYLGKYHVCECTCTELQALSSCSRQLYQSPIGHAIQTCHKVMVKSTFKSLIHRATWVLL